MQSKSKYPLTGNITEQKLKTLIKDVRIILNLNEGIWEDMSDTLVLLAFTNSSALSHGMIPPKILNDMKTNYQVTDYEKFEFLGDRVLDMIIAGWLINLEWQYGHPRVYSNWKSEIVKNASLECYMMSKKLCDRYVGFNVSKKTCADIFESIIGIMYYYITSIEGESYKAFYYIENWLNETFEMKDRVKNVIAGKKAC